MVYIYFLWRIKNDLLFIYVYYALCMVFISVRLICYLLIHNATYISGVTFLSVLDTCGLASMRLEVESNAVLPAMPILHSLTHLTLFNPTTVSYDEDEPLLRHANKLREFECYQDVAAPNFLRWLARLKPNPIRYLSVHLVCLSLEHEQTLQRFDVDQLRLDNINTVQIWFSNAGRDYLPFLQRFVSRVSRASTILLYSFDINNHEPTADQLPQFVKSVLTEHFALPPNTVQSWEFRYIFDSFLRGVFRAIVDEIGGDMDGDWVCEDVRLIKTAIGREVVAVLEKWEAHVERVVHDWRGITLVVKSENSPGKQLNIRLTDYGEHRNVENEEDDDEDNDDLDEDGVEQLVWW